MRLLLDTNILIPLLNNTAESMPPRCLDAVSNAQNVCFASAASIWEIAIKAKLGKLPLTVAIALLPERVAALWLTPLPVTFEHAVVDVMPAPATRDPFDRLLLAQCAVEDMRLVTVDRVLAQHPYAWR